MPPSTMTGEVCGQSMFAVTSKYYWTIHNFSSLYEATALGDFVKSPKFSVPGPDDSVVWQVKLYPKGFNESSKEHMSIVLTNLSDFTCWAVCHFKILNSKNELIKHASTGDQTFVTFKGLGIFKMLKQDIVMDKKEGVLSNDKLTIECEITVKSSDEDEIEVLENEETAKKENVEVFLQLTTLSHQEMNEISMTIDNATEFNNEELEKETHKADDTKEFDKTESGGTLSSF